MISPAMDLAPSHGLGQPANDAPATMPHNLEAEQALLGILLWDNATFDRASDRTKGASFYEPFHQRLFAQIEDHVRRGALAEPITLADKFKGDQAFDELGGLRYLADLVDRAPPGANAGDYALAIEDNAVRREAIRLADEIRRDALGQGDKHLPAREIVERAEQGLFALAEGDKKAGGFQPFSAAAHGFMEQVKLAFASDGGVGGIPTNLTDLDRKVGGLYPSDLIILAGRPSMGKTALATNIAFNVARRYRGEQQPDGTIKTISGGKVGFYSLEMSKEQLAGRIICDVAGVSSDRVRKGEVTAVEIARMVEVERELAQLPIYIDDAGGLSIAKLTARARRLKRQQGLDLIVVDYLQLATGSIEAKRGGRVQEVTEISTGLKALAKELACPVIALSQLSRKVEERDDKRPQLSDLRESGSIEQDADQVWFVYREAYYVGRAEPKEGTPEHLTWQEQLDALEGLAEVIVAKQRHGPIGSVKLAFNADAVRFSDLAHDNHFAQARQARDSAPQAQARMPYGDD